MWHLWSLPIKSLFCLYYILGFCYLQLKDSSILHVRRTHHISIHIRKWKHSVLNAKFRCQEWTLEVRGCSSLYSCVAGDLGNWTLKPLLSLYMYVKAVGWLCGIGEGKIYRNQLLGGFWVEQLLLVPLLCFLRPPLISAKSIRASWLPLVGLLSPSFPTNVPFTLAAVPAVVYVTPSALSMNIVYLHGCLIVSEIPVVVPIRETEELVVIHYQQLKTVPVPYLWFNTSSSSNSLVVFEWYARPCKFSSSFVPFPCHYSILMEPLEILYTCPVLGLCVLAQAFPGKPIPTCSAYWVLIHHLSLTSNPISSWKPSQNELLLTPFCEDLCLHLACSSLMPSFLLLFFVHLSFSCSRLHAP